MSELDGTRTISIPSLAFNYVDGKLESIGHQGELYVRERTLRAIDAEMMRSQGAKSRWHELFGTPERAARTLFSDDRHADCADCMIHDGCYAVDMGCLVEDYDALLEWLRGDA